MNGDGHILAYGGRGYGRGGGGAGGAVTFANSARGSFDTGRVSARGGLSDVSESLGLEGGAFSLTSNSASTLSESWSFSGTRYSYYEPNRGRLNAEREEVSNTVRNADGWVPSTRNTDVYLQVTLNEPRLITGLATQGVFAGGCSAPAWRLAALRRRLLPAFCPPPPRPWPLLTRLRNGMPDLVACVLSTAAAERRLCF